MNRKSNFQLFLYFAIIVLMANISALVDLIFHPEIPYFHEEHLIVGGIAALLTAILYGMVLIYAKRLKKFIQEQKHTRELLQEAYSKLKVRTDELITANEQLIDEAEQRKRAEAPMIHSAKMASLGVMAGGIAHEIRNPLAVCSSAAQLISKNPNDRVLREECADKIYSNIHRASQIIENLLKFSRASEEDFGAVNLNEALELTLSLITHQIKLHQIDLNVEFAKDLPYIMGNANLLQQVFLDLILNAYNAMPKGGKLTVSTLVNSYGEVEIRFADTGCGIPKENLECIFDPFFTTMPVGRGTGLGLSVSYGIVKQHDGSIEVESKVDVGSTFTVKLPLARDWKK
jgi:signal transduction histidine kinase